MIEKLLQSERILLLEEGLRANKSILIEELWNAPKALIASIAQKATGKHVLIITGGTQEEARLFHDFPFFTDSPVIDFPSWETLPSENIPPSSDIVGERYRVLKQILSAKQPHIILSGLQACLQKLISPKTYQQLDLTLTKGFSISFNDLTEQLLAMGYQRRPIAADKGEFAVRGGIIDIFSVSSPDPVRLEFWGDELESIRIYDPIGQKSVRSIDMAEISPAQELELLQRQDSTTSLFDYLGPNTLVIFDGLLALEDRYTNLLNLGGKGDKSFSTLDEFFVQVEPLQKILWTQEPVEELSEVRHIDQKQTGFYSDSAPLHQVEFEMFNRQWRPFRWRHPFLPIATYIAPEESEPTGEEILAKLPRLPAETQLYFLCSSEQEESHLHEKLLASKITLQCHTHYQLGYLSIGLVLKDIALVIFPLAEITQRYKIRRQKLRSTYHTSPIESFDLTPGELVVHLNNGIGKFIGIDKKPNHLGLPSEFFVIEYADNARLFVPLNQANLITKYIGSDEESPKLHELGTTRWKKIKEKTDRAILGYASDLVQMYAQRSIKEGFIYPADSPDLLSFEEEFPFTETEDQLLAIAEMKKDMSSSKVMDRLICGDVGYGKTEVAMRAAFKAVVDGRKQVAILVPTTVLATQHYENFVERMRHFPINIGLLSRFRSAKEIRETLKGVQEGTVDIVIGTHRLISKDVVFKDLGLIIIDEEQRFGVKAKEHLKQLKIGVDCLTLSATPIPRTLYMSLIGARDMSVINTPPQDRQPIKSILAESSDQLIKTALLREFARDGQAFIIHNRVETIYGLATHIKELLPQARILTAHGQMDAEEIDSAFHAFKSGQADILISTTIIENGIDIPNANTILIDRADMFGLATLYQLRGRVGRWNRRAFAYFFVPNMRVLPEITRKRLNALLESAGYGGGMKIAMRDLEIRGAGNILGEEQSGHVASIGFHLYCKQLKRAVQALQGNMPNALTDTKIELLMDARLPETYVNEVSLRMEIYQRLGESLSWEEVDLLWAEIQDRFGPPPESVIWLYHLTRIRVYALKNGVLSIRQDKISLTFEKKKGQETVTRKIITPKWKTPEEFEKMLLAELEST